MSVVSTLKSRDLYEFIQGKYPQDEFTRFSDGTYRSSCPIHGGTNESSFAVFPDNSWYCFSCNAGGNIIDYLMERENLSYSAAVQQLCQEYSIDLSQDSTFAEQQTIAQKYEGWCRSYEKDVGKCIEYLEKKRGLTRETIQQFRLGWSDRSHAITIPMFDVNSREICAYGYRFFDGKAKYKNTKNIPGVFTKGEYLYNLDKCLGLMRKQKKLYVCEGHFDSIAGIQMGYPTVAYCGISLSKNHVELIRQYSSKLDGFQVVIIPDNDGKASKFVTRARELFQKHYSQASVKVLEITDEAIKDTNDILLAGKTFSDFPVHDIDIYCAREIIKAHPDDIQAQQKKIESYAKGITNPLTKADLAELLSETWGKSLDVVKEFLRVSDVNTEDELMSDLSDIEDCFRAFDESLDEEEITFGYPALDQNVTMRRSWVTVLGAYSFSGKSHMLVDWCLHWTIRLHKRVLLFSLEMTKADILEVIIAKVMGIPQFTVKDFCKTKDGSKVFKEVSEKIGKYLHVVDKNSLSISDIDKYIQIFNMRNPDEPLDVVAVDYFGYLARCDTFEEQSSSARKMKEIAKKNNIAFVMLSQFNKESQKGNMEPTQNALKGAGDIGASADIIILIWRPVISNPPESEIDREAIKYLTKLKVVKARKGLKNNQDRLELTYDPQTSRLEEK